MRFASYHRNDLPAGLLRYQTTTGLDHDQLRDLVARVHTHLGPPGRVGRSPALGLFRSVAIVLVLLRSNMTQATAADLVGVSQPTISRIFRRLAPVIGAVLAPVVPTLGEVTRGRAVLVDGTLVPTWRWASHPHHFSGKHRRSGMTIQVLSDLHGRLLAVSQALPGSTHDLTAFTTVGWELALWGVDVIGDKAYHTSHVITPVRRPRRAVMGRVQRAENTTHARIRCPVERTIAHLKNWRILATGYRGPITDLPGIITTITALELHRQGWTQTI